MHSSDIRICYGSIWVTRTKIHCDMFLSDILLTFGGAGKKLYANVEITALGHNKNFDCKISNLPKPVADQSTVKTRIGIISCGGNSNDGLQGIDARNCYNLAHGYNSWIPFPTMNEARYSFAMEEVSGTLFSVGGNGIRAGMSMEWIDIRNGQSWTKQDLPFKISRHCMTKFNKTHLIVPGGFLNDTVCGID